MSELNPPNTGGDVPVDSKSFKPTENKGLKATENKAAKSAEDKDDEPEFDETNPYGAKEGHTYVIFAHYHEENGKSYKPGQEVQLPTDRAKYLAHVGYVRIK